MKEMTAAELLMALGQCPAFRTFTVEDFIIILKGGQQREYRPNRIFCKMGESSTTAFVVLRGSVEFSGVGDVTTTAGPITLWGENSLVDSTDVPTRKMGVMAGSEGTWLFVIPLGLFNAGMKQRMDKYFQEKMEHYAKINTPGTLG